MFQSIKERVVKLYFRIFKPYDYAAWKDYSFTDERLKFVHLVEAVNYTKIALMPHAYFEFGCHSARTFSSVIRAAYFLGMKEMEFYDFDSFQGLPKTEADAGRCRVPYIASYIPVRCA